MTAAAVVTDQVVDAIRSTATRSGSEYLDLRAVFRGADYDHDETEYLASDVDHPNAAGHLLIATAVAAVISARLHPQSRDLPGAKERRGPRAASPLPRLIR